MKFNRVFVDADSLLYSIGYATQRSIYYVWIDGHQGDPCWVVTDKTWLNKILKDLDSDYEIHKYLYVQPFLSASVTIDQTVQSYKDQFETENVLFYFTGEGNFRESIATIQPYKGNRDPSSKPVHYEALKKHMVEKHGAVIVDGQEADDEVSICQNISNYVCDQMKLEGADPDPSVIVSIDKDLDMVEGWRYNPMRKKDKLYYIEKFEGLRWFYTQLLMGDEQVDNIPGLRGIGKVRAVRLLENCKTIEEMEKIVYDKYKEEYAAPVNAMVEVGQLLWMRTRVNEMWLPKFLGGPYVDEGL